MNPPKKYHDWERIFLDTCTIIEYLRASKIPGIANKAVAREYLLKDYMLVTSADFFKCDVVLTHDVNTFIPIADALNFPSVEVNEDKFSLNDTYIFGLK